MRFILDRITAGRSLRSSYFPPTCHILVFSFPTTSFLTWTISLHGTTHRPGGIPVLKPHDQTRPFTFTDVIPLDFEPSNFQPHLRPSLSSPSCPSHL